MRFFKRLLTAWEKFQAWYCRFLGRRYHCGCGHTARWKTTLNIQGREGVFKIPSKNPEYCPHCWAAAAIRCAWCGYPILPGDPITLYSPREHDFQFPDYSVVYKREPRLQVVGCLGWGCADTGADRSGFWVMPGKVQRVLSPLEELAARGGEDPMIFSDLTDLAQAIPIVDEER